MRLSLRLSLAFLLFAVAVCSAYPGGHFNDFISLPPALLVFVAVPLAALVGAPTAILRALWRGKAAAPADRRHLAAAGRRMARDAFWAGLAVSALALGVTLTAFDSPAEELGEWVALYVLTPVYAGFGHAAGTVVEALATDELPKGEAHAPGWQGVLALVALGLLACTPWFTSTPLPFCAIATVPAALVGYERASARVWGVGALVGAILVVTRAEIEIFKNVNWWFVHDRPVGDIAWTAALATLGVMAVTHLGPRLAPPMRVQV